MAKTYFGPEHYRAFAHSFADRLGVRVQIVDGASPAVDADGNITLPDMHKWQTDEEFTDTCASIIHEVSHVKNGSHKEFKWVRDQNPRRTKLYMDALNAVYDVADETSIGVICADMGNMRADELLVISNANAWNRNNQDYTEPGRQPLHWQILVTGIMRSRMNGVRPVATKEKYRIRRRTLVGNTLIKAHPNVPVRKVFSILDSVRRACEPRHGRRHIDLWLQQKAREIEIQLAQVAPEGNSQGYDPNGPGNSGSQSGAGMPGGMSGGNAGSAGSGSGSQGGGHADPHPTEKGKDAIPSGGKEAGAADTSKATGMFQSAKPGDGSNGGGGQSGQSGQSGQGDGKGDIGPASSGQDNSSASGAGYGWNENPVTTSTANYPPLIDVYQDMLPVIARVAERIAVDGDGMNRERYYRKGGSVRDAYRIFTDGACMGRWAEDPHADGMAVAILLDTSTSMRHVIQGVAAVAEAFAEGMEACAKVQRFQFADGCITVPNFASIGYLANSTMTAEAMTRARQWLIQQEAGKRVMVVLTDGVAADHPERWIVPQLREDGISLIGVALGKFDLAKLEESMPGAALFHADTHDELAIHLEDLAYQMEELTV